MPHSFVSASLCTLQFIYSFVLYQLCSSIYLSVNFSLLPVGTRETVLKERIRMSRRYQAERRRSRAETRPLCYFGLGWEGGHLLCVNSFRNLLGIYHDQWKRLTSNSREGTYVPGPILHGNKGKRSRHNSSSGAACLESIREFIQRLADERGEPYATRFIRERTSIGLRNEEDGTVELPSSVSKRQGKCCPYESLLSVSIFFLRY